MDKLLTFIYIAMFIALVGLYETGRTELIYTVSIVAAITYLCILYRVVKENPLLQAVDVFN